MKRNSGVPPAVLELRRRIQGPKEPAHHLSWKDLLGAPVAWLALLVSLFNAYYSIFYFVDDVRISIDAPASLFYHEPTESILITQPKRATFINAGTREAVITNMEIIFNQPDDRGVDVICRRGGIWRSAKLAFRPTVIKSGQIASVDLIYGDLKSPFQEMRADYKWIDDVIDVQGSNKNRQNGQLTIYECLKFTIVTSSGVSDQVTRYIAKSTIDRQSHFTSSGLIEYMYNPDRPIQLIYANPFHLSSDAN